jgi:hypothetical protein|tara:strand:+ start:315 stop:686 length:372 start_codon:yes stop_codon:yes gene_type:complete
MEKTMKAILINVKTQEITEVEHDGTLKNIYKHVDCSTFDVVDIDGTNDIYVDDEGLFKPNQLYFEYSGTERTIQLAGNGLILGVDEEGESISPTINIEEVRASVRFISEGFSIEPNFEVTAWH